MHWKQWETPPKYFRPSDNWECGRLRSGTPCDCGPDATGKCRISGNLEPSQAKDYCKPRRSLWWRRRRLARAFGLIVVSILAILILSGHDKEILVPGELSSPHAQILSHQTTENRCASCHELHATESVAAFLVQSWSGHVTDRQGQSIKCLDCHGQKLPNAKNFSPHDLPNSSLVAISRKSTPATRWTSLAASLPSQQLISADLACSNCHIEHRGRLNDISFLSNEKCQSCHTNRFESFTQGHPEFTDYPNHREGRILFDHKSHASKHFASKGASFDCRSCHFDESHPSVVGPVGRSVNYEKACAACHDQPLRNSLSDGILVIDLPSFDREKIAAAGLSLGAWPNEASLMTDGTLSPMLRWLLSGSKEGRAVLAKLPVRGKLSELSMSTAESLKLQVELANEIRLLVEELAKGGQPALQSRLTRAMHIQQATIDTSHNATLQTTVLSNKAALLSSGASPDIFRAAWSIWFEDQSVQMTQTIFPKSPVAAVSFGPNPNAQEDPLLEKDPLLQDEAKVEFEKGNPTKNESTRLPAMSPQTHLPHGGWMIDQRRLAIIYVPTGHSDLTLKSWLAAASTQAATDASPHFSDMLAPKGMGTCTECHKLRHQKNEHPIDYNFHNDQLWQAAESDPKIRSFTRFRHEPHLTLPTLSQCTACHSLQDNGRFQSITLQNCIDCHTQQGSGNTCTQCHNYHLNDYHLNATP